MTGRRGFFKSLFLACAGVFLGGKLMACQPPEEVVVASGTTVDNILFQNHLANYRWRFVGQRVSGTVVSYADPSDIDMVIQVNGQDIDRPVDQYTVNHGDTVTVYYV